MGRHPGGPRAPVSGAGRPDDTRPRRPAARSRRRGIPVSAAGDGSPPRARREGRRKFHRTLPAGSPPARGGAAAGASGRRTGRPPGIRRRGWSPRGAGGEKKKEKRPREGCSLEKKHEGGRGRPAPDLRASRRDSGRGRPLHASPLPPLQNARGASAPALGLEGQDVREGISAGACCPPGCEVLLHNGAGNPHVMCIMPHVSLAWAEGALDMRCALDPLHGLLIVSIC